ncbi:type II secretion system protein GspH [Allochromatium palmeri]|uniref:Type II secretion system protein H n=2 Tax=Allochromatium palmeri TaxID=231048 RepID=A0A6N8EH13_9GAMM|nr:type II secretion system protein GspH [Allochromatium palmeri]
MAIAAVIMTAVPTLFSASFPGLEMKSAARRTAATLKLARESAIRRGEETAVLVDLENHRLTLAGYRALSLPNRLSIQLDAASGELIDEQHGAIRFFPDGSSTGGRLVLSHDGYGYQVGVAWLTGRIELETWSE